MGWGGGSKRLPSHFSFICFLGGLGRRSPRLGLGGTEGGAGKEAVWAGSSWLTSLEGRGAGRPRPPQSPAAWALMQGHLHREGLALGGWSWRGGTVCPSEAKAQVGPEEGPVSPHRDPVGRGRLAEPHLWEPPVGTHGSRAFLCTGACTAASARPQLLGSPARPPPGHLTPPACPGWGLLGMPAPTSSAGGTWPPSAPARPLPTPPPVSLLSPWLHP